MSPFLESTGRIGRGSFAIRFFLTVAVWVGLVFGTLHYIGWAWPQDYQRSAAATEQLEAKLEEAKIPPAAEAPAAATSNPAAPAPAPAAPAAASASAAAATTSAPASSAASAASTQPAAASAPSASSAVASQSAKPAPATASAAASSGTNNSASQAFTPAPPPSGPPGAGEPSVAEHPPAPGTNAAAGMIPGTPIAAGVSPSAFPTTAFASTAPAASPSSSSTASSPSTAPAGELGAHPASPGAAVALASPATSAAATPKPPAATGKAPLPYDARLDGYDRHAFGNVSMFFSVVISVFFTGFTLTHVIKRLRDAGLKTTNSIGLLIPGALIAATYIFNRATFQHKPANGGEWFFAIFLGVNALIFAAVLLSLLFKPSRPFDDSEDSDHSDSHAPAH